MDEYDEYDEYECGEYCYYKLEYDYLLNLIHQHLDKDTIKLLEIAGEETSYEDFSHEESLSVKDNLYKCDRCSNEGGKAYWSRKDEKWIRNRLCNNCLNKNNKQNIDE